MINLLTIVSVLGLQVAGAQDCKQQILFLPQTHDISDIREAPMTSAERKNVVESQLQIARFISDNEGVPVFSEQVSSKDIHDSIFPQDALAELRKLYVTSIFPDGLPKSSQDLTDLQAEKLFDNGGDFIEMFRGKLRSIYKVTKGDERAEKLWKTFEKWNKENPGVPYPPEIAKYVYGIREEMALEEIKDFFKKNPSQRKVILIYGANHNFSFYPELFPPECVIVPRSFQAKWSGRLRSGPEGFNARRGYGHGYALSNSYSNKSQPAESEEPTTGQ